MGVNSGHVWTIRAWQCRKDYGDVEELGIDVKNGDRKFQVHKIIGIEEWTNMLYYDLSKKKKLYYALLFLPTELSLRELFNLKSNNIYYILNLM